MTKLTWDDSCAVGIDEIDRQHQDFVRLINRLQLMQEKGAPRELTLHILIELVKYADYHFTSEENFMVLVKYPSLEEHQMEHRKALKNLNERVRKFAAGGVPLEALSEGIAGLIEWFGRHTTKEDKLIGQYMRKLSGAKASADIEQKTS